MAEAGEGAKTTTSEGITPRNAAVPLNSGGMPPPIPPKGPSGDLLALRDATPRASTAPMVLGQKAATPRGTTPMAEAGAPRGLTPRGLTPRPRSQGYAPLAGSSAAPGATPRAPGGNVQGSRRTTPRLTAEVLKANTPRLTAEVPQLPIPPAAPSRSPQGTMPAEKGAASPTSAELLEAAQKKAIELCGDKHKRKPEDEKKAQTEATQRVIEKLAELGIDPEGMSATDILRIFYARGSGSTYWLANREAEKRLNIRASTPKSFGGVLRPRAEKEIRRARDLPVTNVHEYLDQWEIAFLGDMCRSLRCFDEAAEGMSSEYMNKYTRRRYGNQSGRKKFMRPPT